MPDTFLTNGPLLNFYGAPIQLVHPISGEDITLNTVEHWFQACKALYLKGDSLRDRPFAQYATFNQIAMARMPSEAKRMGRAIEIQLPLWNRAAFGYMLQGHIAKFSQHPRLREALLKTGTTRLIEHRPDAIWGDNMDGSGKNLCGRSLMLVRRMARDWQSS